MIVAPTLPANGFRLGLYATGLSFSKSMIALQLVIVNLLKTQNALCSERGVKAAHTVAVAHAQNKRRFLRATSPSQPVGLSLLS